MTDNRGGSPVTLLGFDYGLRRIGVAVGQSLTATASPLPAIAARDGAPDWDGISKVLNEWRPAALVVGIPYNMNDTPQEMTGRAERFCRQLEGRFHLVVHAVDERLSSIDAEDRLRSARKAGQRGRITRPEIDSTAACILLESWFNTERNSR